MSRNSLAAEGRKDIPAEGLACAKALWQGVMWQEEEEEGWCVKGKASLKLFQLGLARYIRPEGQVKDQTPSSKSQGKPLHYFCARALKHVGKDPSCILTKTARWHFGIELREHQEGMEGNQREDYSTSMWETRQLGLGGCGRAVEGLEPGSRLSIDSRVGHGG